MLIEISTYCVIHCETKRVVIECILISDAARASDKDRSLVSATFNEYVTAGLGGPFEKKKFDLWWKKYASLLRILPND